MRKKTTPPNEGARLMDLIKTQAWLCQLEIQELLAQNIRGSWADVITYRMLAVVKQLHKLEGTNEKRNASPQD